jgi:hypothetical protein
VQTAKVWNTG